MGLGGGLWFTQNKILPGSYINFVSASRASAILAERGVAALPLTLSWGVDEEVFTVTADEFQKDSLKIFGYGYTATEMQGLRDLFANIREGHFYKLNSGGTKASNPFATAKYTGSRGNALTTIVSQNEGFTEAKPLYNVTTQFDGIIVDEQEAVAAMTELKPNAYVDWISSANLNLTAGTPFSDGQDGTVADVNYQTFLDKIESYTFNTLGMLSTNNTLKALFANFTRRMRDQVGVKFQCVLYRYSDYDYEGIISVENKLKGELGDTTDSAAMVYWVTGAQAGCPVNKTLTNALYKGEFSPDLAYTQKQLEEGIKAGKLLFHRVNDTVRLLEDLNTFVGFTEEKNQDFASNQTVRILDQIGNDIAAVFNTKYLGKVPNDEAGRISLWNDIVKHHRELERLRAIENFDPEKLLVEPGETKKAVRVTDYVTPINAMAQLYMTVIVE